MSCNKAQIEHNPKARLLNNFYTKLRETYESNDHSDELDFRVAPRDPNTSKTDLREIPESKLYGNVTKEEFEHILSAYEVQQQDPKNKNKPVVCKKVIGGSYAKLLFSKPGFHNIDSTSYLVDNLRITDLQRDSFLGGHMKYATLPEYDIRSLQRSQQRMYMKELADQGETLLAQKEHREVDELLKRMAEIDKNNPDFLWLRGRYYLGQSNPETGVEDLRKALQSRPDDIKIKEWLSDGLVSLSQRQYQMERYPRAYEICLEALNINPANQSGQLHLNLCKNKIRLTTPFAPKPLQPRK